MQIVKIRLLRNNDSTNDDIYSIRMEDYNVIRLTFREGTRFCTSSTMTPAEFREWIEVFGNLLLVDRQPFQWVQWEFSIMPTILQTVEDLRDELNWETIQDAFEFSLKRAVKVFAPSFQ